MENKHNNQELKNEYNSSIVFNDTIAEGEIINEDEAVKISDFKIILVVSFFVGLLVESPAFIDSSMKWFGFPITIPLAVFISIYLIKIFRIRRDFVVFIVPMISCFLFMTFTVSFWMARGNGSEMSVALVIIGVPISIIYGIIVGANIWQRVKK